MRTALLELAGRPPEDADEEQPVIARIWRGRVRPDRAEAYLGLMRDVAIRDYAATPGNLGAWCLHRAEADHVVVQMLTFWTDMDAIARFAGDDVARARYYDFDPDYLIEMPPTVEHYEML